MIARSSRASRLPPVRSTYTANAFLSKPKPYHENAPPPASPPGAPVPFAAPDKSTAPSCCGASATLPSLPHLPNRSPSPSLSPPCPTGALPDAARSQSLRVPSFEDDAMIRPAATAMPVTQSVWDANMPVHSGCGGSFSPVWSTPSPPISAGLLSPRPAESYGEKIRVGSRVAEGG